jgi:hypothetical protein
MFEVLFVACWVTCTKSMEMVSMPQILWYFKVYALIGVLEVGLLPVEGVVAAREERVVLVLEEVLVGTGMRLLMIKMIL